MIGGVLLMTGECPGGCKVVAVTGVSTGLSIGAEESSEECLLLRQSNVKSSVFY